MPRPGQAAGESATSEKISVMWDGDRAKRLVPFFCALHAAVEHAWGRSIGEDLASA
jgi:hypothetical protein